LLCLAVWSVTPGRAQPQAGKQPFQNSVAQRNDMLRELREIKALLKEQNAILRKQAANN
jgi:hypothetical protein